ncbi:MAG: choice-of-anchor L domain-containing protein [Myxococcales bacterium]|nr:choice-of-anchor L domain-containing protein [Myxococcales bacterium]
MARSLRSPSLVLSLAVVVACSSDDTASTVTDTSGATLPTTVSASATASASDGSSGSTSDASGSGSASQGTTSTTGATSETGSTSASSDSDGTSGTTGGVMCTDADCPNGQFCNAMSGMCEPGCNEDADCMAPTVCDLESNTCKGCVVDGNCALGTICVESECVPGCNDQQPCQGGLKCCGGECYDVLVDLGNCGDCDQVCDAYPNAEALCEGGSCLFGPCANGYEDCDKNPDNGCEVKGQCACDPGSQIECYTGDANTKNVGKCKSGMATCNPEGTAYGPCEGEVLPEAVDACSNNVDDNCNGVVDEDPDLDKDGWTVCGGDCCDEIGIACMNPELVNPGAFEVANNMVDDDCDGVKDNAVALCDGGLASNSANALDYAKAIDLCQFTVENPPLKDKKWGVISGALTLANGAGNPNANSRSIRDKFGTNNPAKKGQRLAVLSSGYAAAPGQTNPNYAAFQGGVNTGTSSAAPADWLAANGNKFPNAPGCPAAPSTTAYNPVQLKLRIRVPTNANSFSAKMFFYSAEYPEYVCTSFNDYFVTLVDSTDNGNPADKNIAIYKSGNNTYPVGVNILKAANGLFTECKNGTISQCQAPTAYNGCTGTSLVTGTGFDVNASACGYNGFTGGGTGWLTMSGNVTPGETMEIRFTIWDTGDQVWDSVVLLDSWEWSVQAAQPGVQPG